MWGQHSLLFGITAEVLRKLSKIISCSKTKVTQSLQCNSKSVTLLGYLSAATVSPAVTWMEEPGGGKKGRLALQPWICRWRPQLYLFWLVLGLFWIFTWPRLRCYLILNCFDLAPPPGWYWPWMSHIILAIVVDRPVPQARCALLESACMRVSFPFQMCRELYLKILDTSFTLGPEC